MEFERSTKTEERFEVLGRQKAGLLHCSPVWSGKAKTLKMETVTAGYCHCLVDPGMPKSSPHFVKPETKMTDC